MSTTETQAKQHANEDYRKRTVNIYRLSSPNKVRNQRTRSSTTILDRVILTSERVPVQERMDRASRSRTFVPRKHYIKEHAPTPTRLLFDINREIRMKTPLVDDDSKTPLSLENDSLPASGNRTGPDSKTGE